MIRTLVVEDEKVAAQAHATYVQDVPGYELVAVALSAQEAARVLREERVDLVLLDMHLPDGHGLDLLRRLRAAGSRVDVMAVTSARETSTWCATRWRRAWWATSSSRSRSARCGTA